jgi:Fe(3+) dicitrate transport protein
MTSRSTSSTVAISVALVSAAFAQDALESLEPMTVLGSRDAVFRQTGSAAYISEEEIRTASSTNINQVLAKVPGVYVREEDGYGNFPNISLRGADGTRSEKVTLMEDGILTAPAPSLGSGSIFQPNAF